MKIVNKQELREQREEGRAPYQTPEIIYEGNITARAGSPLSPSGSDDGVDPADLFGNG